MMYIIGFLCFNFLFMFLKGYDLSNLIDILVLIYSWISIDIMYLILSEFPNFISLWILIV